MSFNSSNNPTRYFSVVGAAYVAERHSETGVQLNLRSDVYQTETGVAGLWLVFYAVIVGVSLFSTGGAVKVMEVAAVSVQ